MKESDAELICRKTDFGVVCTWTGGKFAEVSGETIASALGKERITPGLVFKFGRLRMRVVVFPVFRPWGHYCDTALVMLESPHAQLYWLYREKAEKIIRILLNIEARINGFLLRPWEGKKMPFTAWVADRLL